MLKIHVVDEGVAARLRELDVDHLTEISTSPYALPAALVIAPSGQDDADIVIPHDEVNELWRSRVEPFARNVAEGRLVSAGPAKLEPPDPRWAVTARQLSERIMQAVAHLTDSERFSVEHIGSTSIPGLAAKPIIDLQLGVPALDRLDGIENAVAAVGFVDVASSRPGSPGVLRDFPRGRFASAKDCWGKRLFASADPGRPAILHVRQIGSPWWGYTVEFRDWLRTHPDARDDYQRMKLELAAAHASDIDYDQYTLGKTAWFDRHQAQFEAWNASRPSP
ncbi:GrpB family protein [Actinocrispum wychmicini]|uniref:Dephospho-CoA kinase n=1 Tax=Actinocrispum wychmicini TaxID=1213861 RepID=A0A4R2IY83_9PSEU|nr:GrpB family protein [Actinocrispum wychmicini]TCO50901.1 dephospho-CoA kinase [Actinocrispum wychmicini]